MNSIDIQGGCMCGAIRYRLEQQPRIATLCHCSDCRRACGAQSGAWITVPGRSFTFVMGEPTRFRSSPTVVRTFCGTCGTSLTYEIEERAQEIDITTASLDDPEAFPPTKEVFGEQMLSWVRAPSPP